MQAKDRCSNCKGKKIVPEKKLLEVHIDKGMKGGQTIYFRGESDQAPGAEPGDVVIVIDEKPHDRFKRQENDLITEVEIDLLTALGGGQLAIRHLDDRALIVNLDPSSVVKHGTCRIWESTSAGYNSSRNAGDLKVIPGQGMPSQRHHEPGDLYVKISVRFPDSIDPECVLHLERALPPRKPVDKFEKNILLEEVTIADADTRQRRGMYNHDEGMEEEHDEARVQCANQ